MRETRDNEALSFGDALFLYLERQGMPLNVASVCIFEGAIEFEKFAAFIESKLRLIPRYLQRVVTPPFDLGTPSWQYDPDFNIDNHVRQVVLRRGTEGELKSIASRILSKNMDRARPLWDLTLVSGLTESRSALIARVHHCMVDGVAGVALMNVIMDASPIPPKLPKKRRPFRPPPARDSGTLLLDGLITSIFSSVERVLSAQNDVLGVAQRIAASLGDSTRQPFVPSFNGLTGNGHMLPLEELMRLLPEMLAPTQRLPFNTVCRGPQKFAWAEIPLDRIKRVKDASGATINDVFLALLTDAVRHYVALHGVQTTGRVLRIIVPVNARSNGDAGELGNRVTFVPVTVPLDIRDPLKLVACVKERTSFIKKSRFVELVGLAGTLLTMVPAPIQAFAGPIASQLPISVCNMICTNVPGPITPLYMLGHKMMSWYPYVPIGGEMGVNSAVLTYNGTAFFGFAADVHAAPDVDRLARFIKTSFADLQSHAGIRMPRHPRVKPTKVEHEPTAPDAIAPAQTPQLSTASDYHAPSSAESEKPLSNSG